MNTNVICFSSRSGIPSFDAKPLFVRQQSPIGSFSTLVHEARNPVCTIDLACDMLNLTSLNEEQRRCVEIIVRSSGRISEFIDGLLETGGGEEKVL